MQHSSLIRTRSQHFVSSPRKLASPLKTKTRHGSAALPHISKKRKVNVPALGLSRSINLVEDSDVNDEGEDASFNSGRHIGKKAKGKGKGKARMDDELEDMIEVDDVEEEYDSSPRKRKRRDGEGASSQSTTGSGGSSVWIEVDEEEEEEPEFIAESDQYFLAEAPAKALHKLPKSELIRLWKVAGMWSTEEEDDGEVEPGDEEDDAGLDKDQLVEGLVAARRHSQLISPIPSPRRTGLSSSIDLKRLRSVSTNNTDTHSPQSSTSPSRSRSFSNPKSRNSRPNPQHLDTDTTPRASRPSRTHTRVNGSASTSRRTARGKSEKGNRKARFGESPKKTRQTRRASIANSGYDTTDTSTSELDEIQVVNTPRRRKGSRVLSKKAEDEVVVVSDSEEEGMEEPTPMVSRLRSRTRSRGDLEVELNGVGDEEEDGGDEAEEEDGEEEESPVPSRKLRSSQQMEDEAEGNVEMGDEEEEEQEGEDGEDVEVDEEVDGEIEADAESLAVPIRRRRLPVRGAKRNARRLLKEEEGDEEGEDVSEGMEVDGEEEDQGDATGEENMDEGAVTVGEEEEAMNEDEGEEVEEDSPRSGPVTRSQKSRPSPSPSPEEDQEAEADESSPTLSRTTRSGRAFGDVRSRRMQLRQEAKDDPDMSDEEQDEISQDDESEVFEDVDLSAATIASLTRLLRDELVQLCEVRGIEVGGTKPQLAQALLNWHDEQTQTDTTSVASSQATARSRKSKSSKSKSKSKSKPSRSRQSRHTPTSQPVIHAIASHTHVSGKTTPVLLRDHIHVTDPATPPLSDEAHPSRQSKDTANGDGDLDLDLSELGLENAVITPDQLVKLEKIGSGGFKDVYVGKYRRSKVAIAEFRSHLSEMDINELRLLGELSHPNIVRFRGICIPEDNSQVPCMLVSELCENGDLFDYIRNVSCPPIKRVLHLMLDIAKGLEYLHTRDPAIIHRDCKSSNILINASGQAKVGDFGLARVKRSTRSMIRSLVGTVNWQAPELWHPQPRYDYKVDVFSAAMVYWEMLSGWIGEKNYPWEGHNEHYIYDAVGTKHRRPSVAGLRKYWGVEPVNLIERMWHQDPRERPTMTDVVADLEAILAGPM